MPIDGIAPRALLYGRVLLELMRYDALFVLLGLRGVQPRPCAASAGGSSFGAEGEQAICDAMAAVVPFYWKPIRCLQRSIVMTRLMRRNGIHAQVVIGYRAAPFFGHAWVEVDGRAVGDSPVYGSRLHILQRI